MLCILLYRSYILLCIVNTSHVESITAIKRHTQYCDAGNDGREMMMTMMVMVTMMISVGKSCNRCQSKTHFIHILSIVSYLFTSIVEMMKFILLILLIVPLVQSTSFPGKYTQQFISGLINPLSF